MNERMKELSNIAYMNHMERNPHSSFGRRYDYDKELAELIVWECMEQVFYTIEDQEQDNISGSIRDRIKEHFGVEECLRS